MNKRRVTKRSAFQLAGWMLGLVAFAQLLIAGVFLARRVEAAREVRIEEKIVTKLVNVARAMPAGNEQNPAPPVVSLPPPPEIPAAPLPTARTLQAPPIADPVIERLVHEAREARVADDMATAIVKLQEARERDAGEPSVLYELGLVYEAMAAYDPGLANKAADAYQQVYNLGAGHAGALYQLAARKLSEGISTPADMRGKLAFGRVRVFQDDNFEFGERVILTIPVTAAPGSEPEASDFIVSVLPFDQQPNGRVATYGPDSSITNEWVTGPIDWAGGEEVLRTTYIIPHSSSRDAHLFGERKYYGYVIQLFYKNELIDVAAYPRHLSGEVHVPSQQTAEDPLFLDQDLLPSDFDPNSPLLPSLNEPFPGGAYDNSLPPFPDP